MHYVDKTQGFMLEQVEQIFPTGLYVNYPSTDSEYRTCESLYIVATLQQ